jgi:hypothetical protein
LTLRWALNPHIICFRLWPYCPPCLLWAKIASAERAGSGRCSNSDALAVQPPKPGFGGSGSGSGSSLRSYAVLRRPSSQRLPVRFVYLLDAEAGCHALLSGEENFESSCRWPSNATTRWKYKLAPLCFSFLNPVWILDEKSNRRAIGSIERVQAMNRPLLPALWI